MKQLFLVPWLFFLPHALIAQCQAVVSGSVIDVAGAPVPQANVSLRPTKHAPGHRLQRSVEAANDGTYRAVVSEPGSYYVLAKKESSGYPDTAMAFYNDSEPTKVDVVCGSDIPDVLVRLNPKAGHIRSITVVDALTGKAVDGASVTLRRALQQDLFISTSTTYKDIAVPAGVDVLYEISAPGYITSAPQTLHLASDESTDLQVTLSPAS